LKSTGSLYRLVYEFDSNLTYYRNGDCTGPVRRSI